MISTPFERNKNRYYPHISSAWGGGIFLSRQCGHEGIVNLKDWKWRRYHSCEFLWILLKLTMLSWTFFWKKVKKGHDCNVFLTKNPETIIHGYNIDFVREISRQNPNILSNWWPAPGHFLKRKSGHKGRLNWKEWKWRLYYSGIFVCFFAQIYNFMRIFLEKSDKNAKKAG